VRTSQRGVRAAAEKVCLEIYNDEGCNELADGRQYS
jgi:hypothetical protein